MHVTLRQLRSFIAVAERGSYRRAAEEIAISQPALSSHVKELEAHLGLTLFHRTTRKVTLTEIGESFLARAKRAVAELDLAIDDLKQFAAIRQTRIVVGCTPGIAVSVLPHALVALRQRHPDIEVQIYDERTELIHARVLTGEVDFAVGPAPRRSGELAFRHLLDDPFVLICPKHHRLSRRKAIPLGELADYPLIATRRGLSMREHLDRGFREIGVELRPTIEVFYHYTLVSLVEAGIGLGVMPRTTFSISPPKELTAVRVVEPEIVRDIGVTWRRGAPLTKASNRFIDTFSDIILRAAERVPLFDAAPA